MNITIPVHEVQIDKRRPKVFPCPGNGMAIEIPPDWVIWCKPHQHNSAHDVMGDAVIVDGNPWRAEWHDERYSFAATGDGFEAISHNIYYQFPVAKFNPAMVAKVYHAIGGRPYKLNECPIPDNWLIWFNRLQSPMQSELGSCNTHAYNKHGFFSATSPDDEEAIQENIRRGCAIVQYHSVGEVVAWADVMHGLSDGFGSVDDVSMIIQLWVKEFVSQLPQEIELP